MVTDLGQGNVWHAPVIRYVPVITGGATARPNFQGNPYMRTPFDVDRPIRYMGRSMFSGVSHAVACCRNVSRGLSAIAQFLV